MMFIVVNLSHKYVYPRSDDEHDSDPFPSIRKVIEYDIPEQSSGYDLEVLEWSEDSCLAHFERPDNDEMSHTSDNPQSEYHPPPNPKFRNFVR